MADVDPTIDKPDQDLIHKQIGRYHMKRLIGSGGMGSVYEAVQDKPRRTVAVKVMKPGLASRSALRRFEYESQLLARLRHPGIAEVYDAGTHNERGVSVPYFVMEYIPRAKRITHYAREKKLGTRQRLELFVKVCQAVQHGHLKGIIHRDLKPDNILVDSHGQPKIIDFGVARATDSDLAVATQQTDIGQLIGTVQYMSPEQVDADPHDLDTRADVYSLGVVLYKLLCEKLPYDVSKVPVYEATRIIREQEAKRLSTIDSTLKGDVETIVLKALEKDRERRYQSAQELAADIRRYLNNEPIAARPPSLTYQLRVFARRNKALIGAVGAVFVALCVGLVVAMAMYVQAENARRLAVRAQGVAHQKTAEATKQRERARQQQELAESERDRAIVAEKAAREAQDEAEQAKEQLRGQVYVSDMNAAVQAWDASNIRRTLRLLNRHRAEPEQADLRGFEWYYLWRHCYISLTTPGIKHTEAVGAVAFSPDGKTIASGSGSTVKLWHAGTHKIERTFEGHQGAVSCLAFSPHGDILASGSADQTVKLWDINSGTLLDTLKGHQGTITSLAFSRDGTMLAASTGNRRGKVKLWDVPMAKLVGVFEDPAPPRRNAWSVAISPDDKTLATADWGGGLTFWDRETRQQLHTQRAHLGHTNCVTFSPDGQTVATAGNDSTVRLWEVATYTQLAILRGHSGPVMSVVFSPDGKSLASASVDSTVRMWDIATKEQIRIFNGHTAGVTIVAFSPDGKSLASGGRDNTLKLWDATAKSEPTTLTGHPLFVADLTLSPDANTLASISHGRDLRLWDIATGSSEPFPESLWALDFSSKGESLALVTTSGDVKIWDVGLREELETFKGAKARCAVFSPNGKILATGSNREGNVTLWDTQTWEAGAPIGNFFGWFGGSNLAFSPDGNTLAIPGSDYTVSLWDVANRLQKGPPLKGHTDCIACLAFSRDGKTLASGGFDSSVIVWDLVSRRSHTLRGHMEKIYSLAFSPDGKTLATGGVEGILLWNLATKEQVAWLKGHSGIVKCMVFSPDGKTLISGSFDSTIKLWRAATEEDVLAADWMDNIELPPEHVGNY